MANSFNCPNCGQKLTAKTEMAGVIIDCPSCGSQIQVPAFEAPVPMAPPPPTYPPSAIPQRFQNPYEQQMGGPQPYTPQMPMQQQYGYPPQQPYGYPPQPAPKSNKAGVIALIVATVLLGAGVGVYFLLVDEKAPIATTEKGKVVQVVNAVLEKNKIGEYGEEYWVDWKKDEARKLFTPTSWEILTVEIGDADAKVLLHVDSSNRGGVKVSTLQEFKLQKQYGQWKVSSFATKED